MMNKIRTVPFSLLKFAVMFTFFMAYTLSIAADDETSIPPGGWQIRKATDASGCINMTGEYQQRNGKGDGSVK